MCAGLGRRGTKERGGVRYRKRRGGYGNEGGGGRRREWEGVRRPEPFLVRIALLLNWDSLPGIPPPGGNSGSERGGGGSPSVNVPTVKSGVPLTPPVSRGRGIPSHTRQGVTCWRRGPCLPWASLRTTLQALCSSFQPTDWASVQDRCHGLRDLDQHLVLWLIAAGLARSDFLP